MTVAAAPALPQNVDMWQSNALAKPGNYSDAADFTAANSQELQDLLNIAHPGTIIDLVPGVTYGRAPQNADGPAFVVGERQPNPGEPIDPDPNDGDWIIIRTAGSQNDEGRVGPDTAGNLAKLLGDVVTSGDRGNVLRLEPGASHIWFSGVEFIGQAGSGIITVGSGNTNTVTLNESSTQTVNLDDYVPHHLVFERNYIHAKGDSKSKAGIFMDGNHIAVVDSYISNIKQTGEESYALKATNGEGPFYIANNYLEAAGINVLFGGDDPTFEYSDSVDNAAGRKVVADGWKPYELSPSDITFVDNVVAKKWSWRGKAWSDKNLFETKNAKRVLVERNVFQNNNLDATGEQEYSWVFKSVDQFIGPGYDLRDCYWCQTADVTVRQNVLRHAKGGISVLGRASAVVNFSERVTSRIQIVNNLMYDISRDHGGSGNPVQITDEFTDVDISNNTFISDNGKVGITVPPAPSQLKGNNFSFDNNIVPFNDFGAVKANGLDDGVTGLGTRIVPADPNDSTVNGYSFENNGIYGATSGDYASAVFAQDIGAALFKDELRYDYELESNSPFQGIGADITTLCAVVQCTSPDVGGLDASGVLTDIPDGDLTPADFDVAIQQMLLASPPATFDFDGNGTVELMADMTAYVIGEQWMNTMFGDVDYNQMVNFADFLIVSANFGNDGSWSLGDTDFDGDIDFDDFLAGVSAHFGWVSE